MRCRWKAKRRGSYGEKGVGKNGGFGGSRLWGGGGTGVGDAKFVRELCKEGPGGGIILL